MMDCLLPWQVEASSQFGDSLERAGQAQQAMMEDESGLHNIGLLAEGVEIRPNDRLIYINGGGGGYGPPWDVNQNWSLMMYLTGG